MPFRPGLRAGSGPNPVKLEGFGVWAVETVLS